MSSNEGRVIREDIHGLQAPENYLVLDVHPVGGTQRDEMNDVVIELTEEYAKLAAWIEEIQECQRLVSEHEFPQDGTEPTEVPAGLMDRCNQEVNAASLVVLNLLRFQKKDARSTISHMVHRLDANLQSLLKRKNGHMPMHSIRFLNF